MPDTTGTLDLIDGAIRDWETSPDAMRWGPDIKPADTEPPSAYDALYEQLAAMHTALIRGLAETFTSFSAGLEALVAAIQPVLAAETAHNKDAELRARWHRRRCAWCNPSCAITPPCPGGSEYHRRLKARARREAALMTGTVPGTIPSDSSQSQRVEF